jgi:ABC-type multidrug transport system fused ATPase/permease subunit
MDRMVEIQSGKIEVDGYNIRDIGLDTLRSHLALVPQDSTLFLGTLRDNLYAPFICHYMLSFADTS